MSDPRENSVSDDMLMALADGELEPEQADALRARIENDPALAARYAVFTETANALRAAYTQDGVPDRLVKAVLATPAATDKPATKTANNILPVLPRVAWPLALAATLAAGVGLGWGLRSPDGPAGTPGLADVARTVSDVPTGQTYDVAGFGTARVLGTFDTEQGLCRLIAVSPASDPAGRFLACRKGGDWRIAISVTDGPDSGFTPASDVATEVIDDFLSAIGAGRALTVEAEASALR
ncbi:hypothetical protein M8756_16040 [Lutimaribacter sp. EGI FJ00015]|uniref:Uncharacterized protein n=1 Tax=Lutimaribacter degradans TaxID=2945989 RepID=A0ACC5ZZM8_9RHOB|nr:hypothetical protein [Lutimaribacter sp. EGI FJ00013]MCM2563635.1 hypothetical protein [Lutimaribacter sp. EGI FJ00013]MCO0614829.1 hypothetical protein [Lutimaribacter sp. EGI FJ00015]MCO0637487.1 hypothetical protein [Lutimaribacter sp. EGI FJ00014]